MKFNDVKRFSAYVRTKYHSKYITLMTIILKLGTTVLTNIYTPLHGENSWKSHVLVNIIVANMYIGGNISFCHPGMKILPSIYILMTINIAINMHINDNQYCH